MKAEKKTGADRTQLAVRDEWWNDTRIKTFLDCETSSSTALDFHVLSKAYQGMVPEAFARFIEFFNADGRNLNEKNSRSETILSIVSEHKDSVEYKEILEKAGATT